MVTQYIEYRRIISIKFGMSSSIDSSQFSLLIGQLQGNICKFEH